MTRPRQVEAEDAASPPEGELSIRLFGPLDLRVAGQALPPFRTRKEGWVFALLALRAGRRVDRDWLAATLWPESPPLQARYNLRRGLSDLRRNLGPHAARLTTPTSRSLCLHLEGAATDALAFDAAIARGDPASLEAAVALYRGPLLEDCTEEWVLQERAPRHEAHLAALRRLAEQARARGDPTAAGYLHRAVAAEPLDESLHRDLMRILAANGNWAGVTQVYSDLRQLLYRELIATPDPKTTALYELLRAEARRKAAACAGSRASRDP